jgi:hypothetical protein
MKSTFEESRKNAKPRAARERLILMETPCVVRAID